jgi:hypothetical protein
VVVEHDLGGSGIFICTGNSTAEAALWKGTSSSEPLFELVLCLKILEMLKGLILHVVHVSGRRMIAQGADGLSQADHSKGVMQGKPMEDFISLHLSSTQREPAVKEWFDKVTQGLDFGWLSPKGSFTEAHTQGNFVWDIPPAAAEVVVEQLDFARLKRPSRFILFLFPD